MKKKPLIILINGAPLVGKDTAADVILKIVDSIRYRMTTPLDRVLRETLHMDLKEYNRIRHSSLKDTHIVRNGKTMRQLLIELSGYLKQMYGEHYFTDYAIDWIKDIVTSHTVIPDIGFTAEAIKFKEAFGDRVLGITIHRPNHDYSFDSREDVNWECVGCKHLIVHNILPLKYYQQYIEELIIEQIKEYYK